MIMLHSILIPVTILLLSSFNLVNGFILRKPAVIGTFFRRVETSHILSEEYFSDSKRMFLNSAKSTNYGDNSNDDNESKESDSANYTEGSPRNVPAVKRNVLPNGHLYVPVGKNRNGNMIKKSADVIQK